MVLVAYPTSRSSARGRASIGILKTGQQGTCSPADRNIVHEAEVCMTSHQ